MTIFLIPSQLQDSITKSILQFMFNCHALVDGLGVTVNNAYLELAVVSGAGTIMHVVYNVKGIVVPKVLEKWLLWW